MAGGVRKLTLKNCQLDQAGEVSYQALNAITSAMLNVKGKEVLLVYRIGLTMYHVFEDISCKNKGVRSVDNKIKLFSI